MKNDLKVNPEHFDKAVEGLKEEGKDAQEIATAILIGYASNIFSKETTVSLLKRLGAEVEKEVVELDEEKGREMLRKRFGIVLSSKEA